MIFCFWKGLFYLIHFKHFQTIIGCRTAPTTVNLEVSRINEGFPNLASIYLAKGLSWISTINFFATTDEPNKITKLHDIYRYVPPNNTSCLSSSINTQRKQSNSGCLYRSNRNWLQRKKPSGIMSFSTYCASNSIPIRNKCVDTSSQNASCRPELYV